MSDLNDILPAGPGNGNRKPLSEAKLMAYLEGRLSPAEQHEVEQWMAEDGMEGDALEGLGDIHTEDARQATGRLNRKLDKALAVKKKKRRTPLSSRHTIMAIAIILLLAVLAFMVIKLA